MRIGETIATYDVGLALRGKSGKFEVTSPGGEIYEVGCKTNHSISDLEWSSNGTDHPPFLIRRVAASIELLYVEDDPGTGVPSACVYLKRKLQDHAVATETLTSRCASFNDLDSEIRRLQAELDEIRSRAKKMFYKAQAVAATA